MSKEPESVCKKCQGQGRYWNSFMSEMTLCSACDGVGKIVYKDNRQICFEFIRDGWSAKQFTCAKQEWINFTKEIKQHKSCPQTVRCKGCGHSFCHHFKNNVGQQAICSFCDDYSQPFIANPKNRKWCQLYLTKEQLNILYPRPVTRSCTKSN